MNISQEILVLDFGDEKNHDFLRSDPSADFGKGNSNVLFLLHIYFLHFSLNDSQIKQSPLLSHVQQRHQYLP